MAKNIINAIPAFRDNYIWAIHNLAQTEVIVVDPGDAAPVLAYLRDHGLQLKAILITHHHWDHSGGISALVEHFPTIPVYGPAQEQAPVPGVNHPMRENDTIALPAFGLTLHVLDIPGHTLGHIAFVGDGILFCGDTLFSCGCGRVFEGTPAQMVASLNKLKNLPPQTRIYCGHEYTLANIRFAKTVEPRNIALLAYEQKVEALLTDHRPTLPSIMADEWEINPFLRCEALAKTFNDTDLINVFMKLREQKNKFAG